MTELASAYDDSQEVSSRPPRLGDIVRFPSTPEMAKRRNLEILREQISTRKGLAQVLESGATDESRIVDILRIKAHDSSFTLRITTHEPTYARIGATFLQLIEPTDDPSQKPTIHSFLTGKLLSADFFKNLVAINTQAKAEHAGNL